MRILLRDPQSGLFYAGSQWTNDHSQATDFEDTTRAIDHVCERRMGGVEIVMRFDNPELEIPLTIAGTGCQQVPELA